VSEEPGATIAYGKPAEHGAPGVPLQPVAGAGGEHETKHLVVAPSAAGGVAAAHGGTSTTAPHVDVVEEVALPSGAEIRTDLKHGFGASAGPVHVEEGGKVVASAVEEEEESKGPPAAGGSAGAPPTKP
jgi:hypothetical protein